MTLPVERLTVTITMPYQRVKKMTEHKLDLERAMTWGEKKSDTSGTQGHPRRATGGYLELIEGGNSFVQNQGGALTAPDLNNFLRQAFTYGNTKKIFMCGGLVMQAINEIARGQIRVKPELKTYGMAMSSWFTAFGEVDLIFNPLYVQDYAGHAVVLDLDMFKYRYIPNSDTQLRTNIQAPDVDGEVDEYLTECGLQREQAPRHALLKGVTS